MTKTKRQLRAEAVERLKQLDEHNDCEYIVEAMVPEGVTVNRTNWAVELDTIIDLLTDDCGPCYACAKLAELRAENNALRGIVGDLKVPTDPGEAAMMSVDAFVKKQTEHESRDSRDNGWYLRYDGYMTSKSNYLRISGFKASRALDNHQNLVFVKFMGGKEADCRVYAPKLDVCENLHDSSKETQKPRSREADSGNVSDLDDENLHVEQDTREKLEADIAHDFYLYKKPGLERIFGWLDRQDAITHAEVNHDAGIAAHEAGKILREQIDELQSKVDATTAERDELKAENKLLRERKCPGYDPDRHYCEYYAQDFELNDRTVSELKRRVSQLEGDLNSARKSRDELLGFVDRITKLLEE